MKKSKRSYKLSLEDSSRLQEIWSRTFSTTGMWLAAIFAVVGSLSLALLLWKVTPLKRMLPGMADSEITREQMFQMGTKLDSLQRAFQVSKDYVDNVVTVLDTGREAEDSTLAGGQLKQLSVDSLMTASPAERRFVARMSENDRYNLSVLTPIAAEGLIFSHPVEGGIIVDESQKHIKMEMIGPLGKGVNAIADGYVIDCYPVRETYTVIIQHPNGFLSRYSNVGMPLVQQGSQVNSGQRITEPVRGKRTKAFAVELWHDGIPVYPADYILSKRIHNSEEEYDIPVGNRP